METVKEIVGNLLPHMDKDSGREGLASTPARYEKFIGEFLTPTNFEMTVFANEGYNEMVVVSNIPFYSICEHHLIPFFGHASIAYLPDKNIVGLSKLPRTLDHFSRRLQNQERITTQVADFLVENLQPKGVGVVINARHLCMEMRGVRKTGTETTTSCLKGLFKTRPATRNEFLRLQNN